MWIFTVNGFFTVIQDKHDANYVWLRARLREDIERNFPGVTAEEHPGADYLYRVKLPREQVAQRLFELTMENNVTSHFKDVMIRTASKPEFGNRSSMLYGVWHSGGDMQPYAPYSKVPRTKTKTKTFWKNSPADRRPGTGQTNITSPYTYGGAGSGYKGSEFDWDSQSWGGVSHPDPVLPSGKPARSATDEEFEAWWTGLSDDERDAILDEEAAEQRNREEPEEDFGAAARAAQFLAPEVYDVQPSPRNRPGNRKTRRKGKRANRHNQYRELGFSDSQARQESVNRQTYLAKKNGGQA